MRRHLSADAPPFALGGSSARSSDTADGGDSKLPRAAAGAAGAASGPAQSGASLARGSASGSASGGRAGSSACSRALFELAERVQQEERARDSAAADAARALKDVRQQLEAERAARAAAEERASCLDRDLKASQSKLKVSSWCVLVRQAVTCAVHAALARMQVPTAHVV
jgi:hypothetical protein